MERSTSDRFLTTHTGSLARAPELRELLAAKDAGLPYDRPGFDALVSTEVQRVVHEQAAVGIDIINDGEQGKISFVAYRLERLSGFELVDASEVTANTVGGWSKRTTSPSSLPICGNGTAPARTRPLVIRFWPAQPLSGGKISPRSNATSTTFGRRRRRRRRGRGIHDLDLAGHLRPAQPPLPPSEDAYLDALAAAMSREYKAILDAGFILQIDAPDLTTMFRMSRMSESEHHQAHAQRVEAMIWRPSVPCLERTDWRSSNDAHRPHPRRRSR